MPKNELDDLILKRKYYLWHRQNILSFYNNQCIKIRAQLNSNNFILNVHSRYNVVDQASINLRNLWIIYLNINDFIYADSEWDQFDKEKLKNLLSLLYSTKELSEVEYAKYKDEIDILDNIGLYDKRYRISKLDLLILVMNLIKVYENIIPANVMSITRVNKDLYKELFDIKFTF